MAMRIEVVPHDPAWRQTFEIESKEIRRVLEDNLVAIHHIGSTAIPGIHAKPVIDLLVEVEDLVRLDEQSGKMVDLGYEAMGEFGIPGRRYFRRDSSPGIRTHNIHFFGTGSPGLERHLAFRDYLIAHSLEADVYSALKSRLAAEFPNDIEGYMAGKDAYIKRIEAKAITWRRSQKG